MLSLPIIAALVASVIDGMCNIDIIVHPTYAVVDIILAHHLILLSARHVGQNSAHCTSLQILCIDI